MHACRLGLALWSNTVAKDNTTAQINGTAVCVLELGA